MNDFFPGEGRKKITSLFSNERRYNRSGSITTTAFDKEDAIRQSRIMNLPNYKKQSMGSKINFVVVFQTIEIERLSVQIESLRVRLVDSERQIFNYKSYEVQIKELNERCCDYEHERNRFEQQIAFLTASLKAAQHQAVTAKQHCSTLEDNLQDQENMVYSLKEKLLVQQKQWDQLEEGRLMLESTIKQKQKLYSKQMKELEKSTQFKKNEPTKNEEQLGNLLKKYHGEVNTLQEENLGLRNLYDSIEQQSQGLERRYEQLQQKLYENNDLLKQKDFELDGLQQENRLRLETVQQRYEEEYDTKCKRVEECEQEIIEWRGEVDKLESHQERYELKITEYVEQCDRYQALLNEAGDEIDRLNTIIKDKIKYLQAWEGRYKELESSFNTAEDTLNTQSIKITADEEAILRVSHALKYKSEQLEKLEQMRGQEVKAVKEKLQEIETQKYEITVIKREKQLEREDQRRKELENNQIKEQLNKRIVEGNKLFEDLHRAEAQIKQIKVSLTTNETSLRIKDEELNKAKEQIASVDHRIEKLQGQRRTLEQDAMRVKALEERIRHEESKKNQYLNEGKKLSYKLKQNEKQLGESRRKRRELEADLEKFQQYIEQMHAKIGDLQERLELMTQYAKQIAYLTQANQTNEHQIKVLQDTIEQKINQIKSCQEKVTTFHKFMKEFRLREEEYLQNIQIHEKVNGELKMLKLKYEELEDKNDKLEGDLSKAISDNEDLSKENGSLERVIEINGQEMKRSQKIMGETKEDLQSQKKREKQILAKLKEDEKKLKIAIQEIEKDRERLSKEKAQLQRLLERKGKEFQSELKDFKNERDKAIRLKDKQIKSFQNAKEALQEENSSFRVLMRKGDEERQKLNKNGRELQKKILSYEHQLQRNAENSNQNQKELHISQKNIKKMSYKAKQIDETMKEQTERLGELLTDKECLSAEISDQTRIIAANKQEILQLLSENNKLQVELSGLQSQLKSLNEKDAALYEELIVVKFQSSSLNQFNVLLNKRLMNFEKMIGEFKVHVARTIEINDKLEVDKRQIEKKYVEYQDRLTDEVERLEEQQFKAGEEIIRLDTMNRILQIEVGEYKERESVLFTIVKESSLIKERKDASPLKERLRDPIPSMQQLDSPSKKASTNASRTFHRQTMRDSVMQKSEMFDEPNNLYYLSQQRLKSQFIAPRLDEELVQISYCQNKESLPKTDSPPEKSKDKLFFEGLAFKRI